MIKLRPKETIILILLLSIYFKDEVSNIFTSKSSKVPPSACDATTTITGNSHSVLGTAINVRSGPGINFPKVVNEKATNITKNTFHVSIDDSITVYEECTKDGWSWVRVIDPEYLQGSHRGWVSSKFIGKGQDIGGDAYARKISSSALPPKTNRPPMLTG